MKHISKLTSQRVRALNDQLRRDGAGGTIVATSGVRALGHATLKLLLDAVARFDKFSDANDPYREHDFGMVEAGGVTIFFKIDAYDTDLHFHSPDPADPAVTRRVMTLMLPAEY
jgi:hypothetical protein